MRVPSRLARAVPLPLLTAPRPASLKAKATLVVAALVVVAAVVLRVAAPQATGALALAQEQEQASCRQPSVCLTAWVRRVVT